MKHVRASCSVCPGCVIFCEWAVVWYKKLGNENKRLATLYWCDRCVLSSISVSLMATIYHVNLPFSTFRGGGRKKEGEMSDGLGRDT